MAWLGAHAVLFVAGAAVAHEVPVPRPRPPLPAAAPPAASACRLALDGVAIAPDVAPIAGPGDCGGDDLVRLEAVVLAQGRRVTLQPAATLRCGMAAAVAAWVRGDLAALVERDGARLAAIAVADSFSCRGRNRLEGAKLSEHGRANAIDLRALQVEGAAPLALPERATPRELRVGLRETMCARFTTVLGPGSDGYHEDHIHLDLRERSNGYRICQWSIEDEAPLAAPIAAAGSQPAADASAPPLQPMPVQPAALAAVPLPRPRPLAAAAAAVSAPAAAAGTPKRRHRAVRRPPTPPWPFSLFPAR